MAKEKHGHFYIDQTCIACGACDHACPGHVDAIYRVEEDYLGRFAIKVDECIDGGICIPLCPVKCIHDARAEGVVEGGGGYAAIQALQSWASENR